MSACPSVDLKFATELDDETRTHFHRNFSPLFAGGLSCITADLRERNTGIKHHSDLYLAGLPYQPFSSSGLRKGENDLRGRIVHSVIDTLQKSLPKVFILENVVGFTHVAGGAMFQKVIDRLDRIKDDGKKAYDVQHKVRNAIEHGVPQSRRRAFIIGIRRKLKKDDLQWTSPSSP